MAINIFHIKITTRQIARMLQNRSRKKLKLEDITTYYSNKRQYPFSYSRSPTSHNATIQTTPSNINYDSKTSPFKCDYKNRGIMRQAIADRIEEYKKDHKRKFLRKTIEQIRDQTNQKEIKELRESPLINRQSQKIYEKVAQKRNLSPKVLVRFEQYERSKTLSKLKLKIQKFIKQRNKVPKPQDITSPEKLGEIEQAKKLIDIFNQTLSKYCTKPQRLETQ